MDLKKSYDREGGGGGGGCCAFSLGNIIPSVCVYKYDRNTGIQTDTALRKHMRIVFEDMLSWTPLTMYLWMKTTF